MSTVQQSEDTTPTTPPVSQANPPEQIDTQPQETTPHPVEEDNIDSKLLHLQQVLEQAMQQSAEQLQKRFDDKLAYDTTKQQQIDLLHQELVEHRQNLIAKTIRPLVNGIIRMHDDLGRLLDKFQIDSDSPQNPELNPERCLKLLAGVQEDIEILLDQNGVMAFESPNNEFEPRRQTVVKNIPADDPGLVGTIALRVRPGFEQGEELIKKERVNVYVKAPQTQAATETAESTND